jgi:hypothetical protein
LLSSAPACHLDGAARLPTESQAISFSGAILSNLPQARRAYRGDR